MTGTGLQQLEAAFARQAKMNDAEKDAKIKIALDAFQQIEAMPFTQANDSEQLRHTIQILQMIARDSIRKLGGTFS